MQTCFTNVLYSIVKASVPAELDEQVEWHWTAHGGNHEIVCHGETHGRRQEALRAAVGVFGYTVPVFDGVYAEEARYSDDVIRDVWDHISEDQVPPQAEPEEDADEG
jgi:hypothetical protein